MSTPPSTPYSPEPGPGPHRATAPTGAERFFASIRRSGPSRSQDGWIGGVAAGLAQRLGIDPAIVRGVFVVLTVLGGLGMIAYGAAWLLLPAQEDGRIHLEDAFGGRLDNLGLAGGVGMVLVGLMRPGTWWWRWDVWPTLPILALTVTAIGVTLPFLLARRGDAQAGPPAPSASATPTGESPPGWSPPEGPPRASGFAPGAASTPPAPEPVATTEVSWTTPTAQTWTHEAGTSSPAPAPAPPPPPAPRVPGPGARLTAAFFGLALLTAAGIVVADRAGRLDGTAALIALGAVIVVLALGALTASLIGRRQGAMAVVATLLAMVAVPVAPFAAGWPSGAMVTGGWGDATWSPVASTGSSHVGHGLGNLEVDLASGWADVVGGEATADLGMGELTVVVPRGEPVVVEASIGLGSVELPSGSAWEASREGVTSARGRQLSGTGSFTLSSPSVAEATPADVTTVRVNLGVGTVIIEEVGR